MSARTRGFTLVELMVVVVIIGVLASVALMSFRRYVLHARANEVYAMLGEIRIRQEQYRAEFGRYCQANWNPAVVPAEDGADWGNPAPDAWLQIGARPDGVTHFRYQVITGNPGEAPPVDWTPDPPTDYWFIVQAEADLDGDAEPSQFETYSADRRVWVNPGGGGYEYEAQ